MWENSTFRLLEYVEDRGVGWAFHDVDLLFATGHFLRLDLVVVPAGGRKGITDRGVELVAMPAPEAFVARIRERKRRTRQGLCREAILSHRDADRK